MEEQFKNWLSKVRRLQIATVNSYARSIRRISEHYSLNTGNQVDIYSVTDQNIINQIAQDYRQTGRFSEFGYEHHSLNRAAISRYSEFFVHHNAGEDNSVLNEDVVPEIVIKEASENTQNNFSYEKDLQTTLCYQISELFPGYKIFGDHNSGIEYSINGRRIDILLEQENSGDLLAVELKSGVADFKVFGQISMYLGLLQDEFPNKSVSGVIVAGVIHESLKQACSITDRVDLKTYRMSIELENV